MTHPLDGATLRWERADRHLSEADSLIHGWSASCNDHIVGDGNGKYRFPNGWPPLPVALPVVIGDAVHNMRAALDYIIYELAILDSGKPQENTQFIVEDHKIHPVRSDRGFDARSKKHLKGLSPAHVSAIETFQPYKGVTWTKTLVDISNPDKHRHLTVLSHEGRDMPVTIRYGPNGRFPAGFKLTSEGPVIERCDLDFDGHQVITVAPSDPHKPPIMTTLRELQLAVYRTIQAFKPEF